MNKSLAVKVCGAHSGRHQKAERRGMAGSAGFTAETAELRGGRPSRENAVGEAILGCALNVHKALGPGLLENAYEACLAYELGKAGLRYRKQLALPIVYDGHPIDLGYRLDFLVEDLVVIE